MASGLIRYRDVQVMPMWMVRGFTHDIVAYGVWRGGVETVASGIFIGLDKMITESRVEVLSLYVADNVPEGG